MRVNLPSMSKFIRASDMWVLLNQENIVLCRHANAKQTASHIVNSVASPLCIAYFATTEKRYTMC